MLFMFLVSIATSFAQEANPRNTIFLKNGDSFKGQILMRTDEIIIIQTDDGKRYQLQLSEIDRIQQDMKSIDKDGTGKASNFGGIIDLEGGLAYASTEGLQYSPATSATIALGVRDFLKSNVFAGLGSGVQVVFSKNENKNLLLLPLFIQLNKTFTNNSVKPFIGTKAGYAFSLNKEYQGGVLFKLAGGAAFSISRRLSFNVGVFGKIQQISGTVIERNELGKFVKQGTTPLYSTGLNLGFIF